MKNGFALLLSLIVTSILLVVGLGVSGVAFREIQLSSFGNQSEIAFYAAETGLECGMYWDKVMIDASILNDGDSGNDESQAALSSFINDGSGGPIRSMSCLGAGVAPSSLISLLGDTAEFDLGSGNAPCAKVEVKKVETLSHPGSLAWAKTFITSTGYNTCDDSDPRRVGRVLELELNLVAP